LELERWTWRERGGKGRTEATILQGSAVELTRGVGRLDSCGEGRVE